MPYKKGRGYTRTTGYYGRFSPSVALANSELKFLDTTVTQATVGSTGNITNTSLNLIPSGTGESQRVGRKVVIKRIHLKYVCVLKETGTSSSTDDGVRVIVYLDKQCNGATASVTDILETTQYLSFNNLANKNRFTILMDEHTDLRSQSGGGSTVAFGRMAVTKQWHHKCSLPIEFSSTAGSLTEIRSFNIGILTISDRALIELNGKARVRYLDA